MANLYMLLNVIYNVCTDRAKQRTDKETNVRVQKRTYIFLYMCNVHKYIYKCTKCKKKKKNYIKIKFQKKSHACIYPECLHSTCTGTVF